MLQVSLLISPAAIHKQQTLAGISLSRPC